MAIPAQLVVLAYPTPGRTHVVRWFGCPSPSFGAGIPYLIPCTRGLMVRQVDGLAAPVQPVDLAYLILGRTPSGMV